MTATIRVMKASTFDPTHHGEEHLILDGTHPIGGRLFPDHAAAVNALRDARERAQRAVAGGSTVNSDGTRRVMVDGEPVRVQAIPVRIDTLTRTRLLIDAVTRHLLTRD